MGDFPPTGLLRHPWTSPAPLPFGPHSIRSTLVDLAQLRCTTPEAVYGWSQNLGHDDVLTMN